ncbi:putative ferrireductase protein [Halotydeus destructor]|nr:putative ferrireductase protein [Halotydeus destructor]KAI1309311.1 putative ferrireductase protein [Halotydeus destructor]
MAPKRTYFRTTSYTVNEPLLTVQTCNTVRFVLVLLFNILSIGSVCLYAYWIYEYENGVSLDDHHKLFNLHGLLMMSGLALVGLGVTWFLMFPCFSKGVNKFLHFAIFTLAAIFLGAGFWTSYHSQNLSTKVNKYHFYSLHDWMGIGVCAVLAIQFLFGLGSFYVLPLCGYRRLRAAMRPIHATFGLVGYMVGLTTCMTGIFALAKARLKGSKGKKEYHELDRPAIIINMAGICLMALMVIVPLIVRHTR